MILHSHSHPYPSWRRIICNGTLGTECIHAEVENRFGNTHIHMCSAVVLCILHRYAKIQSYGLRLPAPGRLCCRASKTLLLLLWYVCQCDALYFNICHWNIVMRCAKPSHICQASAFQHLLFTLALVIFEMKTIDMCVSVSLFRAAVADGNIVSSCHTCIPMRAISISMVHQHQHSLYMWNGALLRYENNNNNKPTQLHFM